VRGLAEPHVDEVAVAVLTAVMAVEGLVWAVNGRVRDTMDTLVMDRAVTGSDIGS